MPTGTPNATPEPSDLPVAEVARRLGKSEDAVRKLCRDGQLPGACRENAGAPWQIPPSALDAYLRNNPPASFWQRLRTTKLWQRVVATIGAIGVILFVINNVTGFFSNLFGAAPVVEIACQQPFIANLCPPTSAPPQTPTVTSTPLPIRPAAQGETLIIIATFHGELANRDEPQVMIKEGIDKEIAKLRAENKLGDLNLSVAIHPQVLTGGEEAQPVVVDFAKPYSASIVIWGDVTGTRVRVNFLNLRHPDFNAARPAPIEEKTRTAVANPQAYNNFINNDLPGMMSFLTFFAVGQSYYVSEEYAAAAQIIEQGVEALSVGTKIEGLAEAYFRLGWLYQVPLGDLAAAIQAYEQAIQLNSKFVTAYNNRGNARVLQGDLAGSLQDYDQAIQLNPKYAEAYNNRGNARAQQNDATGAIQDYDQAIRLNPKYATAYIGRGNVRYKQGDLASAIKDDNQAIDLNPLDAIAYNNRALVRSDQGDYAGAIQDYDQAIALDPRLATVYYNRGNTRYMQGNHSGAIQDYDQAIQLNPKYAKAYISRGIARAQQTDLAGAIQDLDQAINLNPLDAVAYNNRGIVRYRQDNHVGAIQDYDQAIALDPKLAEAYYNRGSALGVQGDLASAIKDYTQVIQLNPKGADAYGARGSAKYVLGKREEALVDLKIFLELAPKNDHMRSQIEQWITEIEAELTKKK